MLLGFLDVIAVLALIFKTFRWPFWEFRLKLAIIGIALSSVSYLNRMVLDISQIDMAVQFLLYIVFLRFFIKVNLHHAVDVTAIGYLMFMGIQLVIYYWMLAMGVVRFEDAASPVGTVIFVIQFLSDALAFLIAYLFYRLQLGFSFMMRPPHNLYLHRTIDIAKRTKMVFNTVGIITISFSIYWMLNHSEQFFLLPLLTFISLSILIYLSYKRDLHD